MSPSDTSRAVEHLAGARRVVVSTGAGMSRESSIPTFREAPGALWARYNPEELATPEGFTRNPPLVWQWYAERRRMIGQAQPHDGHVALARLETLYEHFLLLTQNIDNLHRAAGSRRLVELHGNIFRFKCFDNGHPAEVVDDDGPAPPRCHCGALIRPDVVWFGEMLDSNDLDRAFAALEACDTLLVVGTSGTVYPAAGFPEVARKAGAAVIEVNPERTPISGIADVSLRATAATALPTLVEAVALARGDH